MKKYLNFKTVGIAIIALLGLCLFLSRTIYSFNMPQVTATTPFSGKLSMIETTVGIVSGTEEGAIDKIDTLQVARAGLELDIENINIKIARVNEELVLARAEQERETALAQGAYERMKSLFEEGAVSRVEMENAENNLQSTIARYNKQIADLENTLTTFRQDIKAKELDMQNNDIQLRPYIDVLTGDGVPGIIATIPLENTFVTVGDECRASNSFRSFTGIVEEIVVTDRGKTVTITASEADVKAGESFTITFTKEGERNERLVPNGAVQQDSQGYFLYKIGRRNGILGNEFFTEKVRIFIGDSDNVNTVILNDIGFFEPVVLSSNRSFEEGQTIALMNAGDFFAQD